MLINASLAFGHLALLRGTSEHFNADKSVRQGEDELFLSGVSALLSFTGAGLTWRALTDTKRWFICQRSLNVSVS